MFELKERQGFISKWMDALNLSPNGLGDDPSESFVHGIISQNFHDRLANPGTFAPFHIGAGGLLWDYSGVPDGLEKRHDPAFGPRQNWRLSIYEISTSPRARSTSPVTATTSTT